MKTGTDEKPIEESQWNIKIYLVNSKEDGKGGTEDQKPEGTNRKHIITR